MKDGGRRWLGAQRWAELPEDAASAWVRAAIGADVSEVWVDLANVYGPATDPTRGETRFAEWVSQTRLRVATKGGLIRTGGQWIPDGRAKALQAACDQSRERLGLDVLPLYQLHAPDPKVKWMTTVRALARLQARGQVERVGLCNVRVAQLRAALDHVAVTSVQAAISPFDAEGVRSGVVEEALERGIEVLAYRPLGGPKGVARLNRDSTVASEAARLGLSAAGLALAWLAGLGLTPIPGPTRPETVHDALHTVEHPLDDAARAALDARFEIGPMLRTRRVERAPTGPSEREVVILVGSPGAGKTHWRRAFAGEHLSRDERGGRLAGLIPVLDERLAAGVQAIALDGTYPTRSMRSRVTEAAWRHGVPVRCVWVPTEAGRCQVQVVHRMIDAIGRLPMPEDLATPVDPALVPPRALTRFRQQLEPPELGEGFAAVEPHVVPPPAARGTAGALFVDADRHLGREHLEVLTEHHTAGRAIVALGWRPGIALDAAQLHYDGLCAQVPFPVHLWWCPHPPGPAVCWCRKPLPGLPVVAIRDLGLDPARCRWWVAGRADRTLAEALQVAALD